MLLGRGDHQIIMILLHITDLYDGMAGKELAMENNWLIGYAAFRWYPDIQSTQPGKF